VLEVKDTGKFADEEAEIVIGPWFLAVSGIDGKVIA
jgi:hypothetical protein